jgi:hypothetical protein
MRVRSATTLRAGKKLSVPTPRANLQLIHTRPSQLSLIGSSIGELHSVIAQCNPFLQPVKQFVLQPDVFSGGAHCAMTMIMPMTITGNCV